MMRETPAEGAPTATNPGAAAVPAHAEQPAATEPVLCGHCGRTASNGLSCIGACVADSGY
ncbi:MAG: hypothetical protein RLZZ336_274 [Cyanobacteriota bacterium]|jgi:hypothetical protein